MAVLFVRVETVSGVLPLADISKFKKGRELLVAKSKGDGKGGKEGKKRDRAGTAASSESAFESRRGARSDTAAAAAENDEANAFLEDVESAFDNLGDGFNKVGGIFGKGLKGVGNLLGVVGQETVYVKVRASLVSLSLSLYGASPSFLLVLC